MNPLVERRQFLAHCGAVVAAVGIPPDPRLRFAVADGASPAPDWDIRWLDQLRGKHKQVFDAGMGEGMLRIVTTWLDMHRAVFNLAPPAVNAVVGIGGGGLPLNIGNAGWAAYELGRRWEVKDPATGVWATRNIYYERPNGTPSVKALMERGAIFWQCDHALTGFAESISQEMGKPAADLRRDLIASFNPGVRLVPAHTLMLGLAQERGCAYQRL